MISFTDSLNDIKNFLVTKNEWFESYVNILVEKNNSIKLPGIIGSSELGEKIFYYSFFYSLFKISNAPTTYLRYAPDIESENDTVRLARSEKIQVLIDDILLGVKFLLPILYEKDQEWFSQIINVIGENKQLKTKINSITKSISLNLSEAKAFSSKNIGKPGKKRIFSLFEFLDKINTIKDYEKLSNVEIGKIIGISESTVRNYKKQILTIK